MLNFVEKKMCLFKIKTLTSHFNERKYNEMYSTNKFSVKI